MVNRPMQPRRGPSALPRVRRPHGSASEGARLLVQITHVSIGGRNPSAVARASCQGNGFISWMSGAPPMTQAVRVSRMASSGRFAYRCRRLSRFIRTDFLVARVGPTTPDGLSVDPIKACDSLNRSRPDPLVRISYHAIAADERPGGAVHALTESSAARAAPQDARLPTLAMPDAKG
jgi:hypothetical protein